MPGTIKVYRISRFKNSKPKKIHIKRISSFKEYINLKTRLKYPDPKNI